MKNEPSNTSIMEEIKGLAFSSKEIEDKMMKGKGKEKKKS